MSSLKYARLRVGDVYEDGYGRIRLHIGPDCELDNDDYPPGGHKALVVFDPTGEETGRVVRYAGSSRTLGEIGLKLHHRRPDR